MSSHNSFDPEPEADLEGARMAAQGDHEDREHDLPNTLTLSKEAFEAVGTSIQNAAGGVDYNLPEYVVIAITENLIASTWLRDRITESQREGIAAVEAVRFELLASWTANNPGKQPTGGIKKILDKLRAALDGDHHA